MCVPAVVVPLRLDEQRQRVWEWVRARYAEHLPDVHILEGPLPEGPWCKAIPVWRGLRTIDVDICIVGDADCWTDGLPAAIEAVERGAPWAIPHWQVHRLSQQGTEAVLSGSEPRTQPLERRPYLGAAGGGFVVARRETLLEIPMDPRYENWGQEDTSWNHALVALAGRPWRGRKDCWHLWHPPMPRQTPRRGSDDSWRLYRRYQRASKNPEAMKVLIGEVLESLAALEHSSDADTSLHVG